MSEDADWITWGAELVARVRALADDETLTIAAPDATRQGVARPKRLGGLMPAAYRPVAPTITLTRREDHLHGTLTGSESFGGTFPTTPEEEDTLHSIGWRRPGPAPERVWLRYWPDDIATAPYLTAEDAASAVTTAMRTLTEVYAVSAPDEVTVG